MDDTYTVASHNWCSHRAEDHASGPIVFQSTTETALIVVLALVVVVALVIIVVIAV